MNPLTRRQISLLLYSGFTMMFWLSQGAQAEARAEQGAQPMADVWLQEQQVESRLVGMAAVVIQGGEVRYLGAAGERKKGSGVAVTVADRWHLGSVTKSMTATVLARLVEAGEVGWDTPLLPVLGLAETAYPDWQGLTLTQLLSHTAGLPANFSMLQSIKVSPDEAARPAARLQAVREVLNKPPNSVPGSEFLYSNVGYTLAGVVIETLTGQGWEQAMRERLFAPLGLNSAGFGPPQSEGGGLSEPRGHRHLFGLTLAASETADNNAIIGPAGTVHLTLEDLARYGYEHLSGERGESTLLSADGYQRLHRPNLEHYAFGWVLREGNAETGPMLWHNGSNTMWYSLLVLVPEHDTVVAMVFNEGDVPRADALAWQWVEYSVQQLNE